MKGLAGSTLGVLPALMLSTLLYAQGKEAIPPVPDLPNTSPAKIALGKKLFSDPLFSQDNSLACASCHSLKNAGVDGLTKYRGIDQKSGDLNTPTVLNAALNTRFFWDGRAADLNAVIEDHIQDKSIFNNTWPVIIDRIKDNSTLKKDFAAADINTIDANTIKGVLVDYLNTLLTPNSPFDRYLKGDKGALSPDAVKGYELFKQYGCVTCHQGPNLGGNLYQKMGIYSDYLAQKGKISQADLGRFNVTGKDKDRAVFMVPGLRNISLTGPYLHDGEAHTLEAVIELMGIYEVGQPIPPFDVPYIVKFLESLNGVDASTTSNAPAPSAPSDLPKVPAGSPRS